MKIKDTLLCEQPREKMASLGVRSLSNSELLAIILGSGTQGANVVEVCNDLLNCSGGTLAGLSAMTVESLSSVKGVGRIKALKVGATIELGRRFCSEQSPQTEAIIGPKIVYDIMLPIMKGLDKEEFWIMYLNAKNKVVKKEKLSTGGQSSTVIDVKILSRRALETRSSGIVMVHNHPSGDPTPSKADIKQTESVHNALKTFDICLLDHVIIGNGRFFSFAEEKTFEEE
ncbi:MAG: DNA repair protein RadC [Bacteroidales bacterium]|nr:DNA repair protein RadC [Bacteroidales bacterium]